MLDGLARALATPPALSAWLLPRALADQLGRHNLVAVTDQPGGRAAMTFAGEADGFVAGVPEGSPWRNEISPGVFATVALQRPVTRARRIAMPLWLGLGERDVSVSSRAIERLASRAPAAESVRRPENGPHAIRCGAEALHRRAGQQRAARGRRRLVACDRARKPRDAGNSRERSPGTGRFGFFLEWKSC